MSYQFISSRNNKSGKKRTLVFVALAICVILFLILRFASGLTGALAQGISAPLLKIESSFGRGGSSFFSYFTSRDGLEAENELLKENLLEANLKVMDYDQLTAQNQQLMAMVGRAGTEHFILAGILSRPNQSPYDTFTIDAGTAEGAALGDEVLAGTEVPIGTISTIYDHTSRVTLYSSPGNTVSVLIGASHVSASATGQGGGNFVVKVPHGVPIAVGDAIISPGISAKIFGTVGNIDLAPNDSFQTIYFNLPITISELQYVEILPATN